MKENEMRTIHAGYHHLMPDGEFHKGGLFCSESMFHEHCRAISSDMCAVLTMSDFAEEFSKDPSVRCVTLSFDDGLKSQFSRAFPILKEYGLTATFFVIACTLQGKLPGVIALQEVIQAVGAEVVEHDLLPHILPAPYKELLNPVRLNIGNWYGNEAPEVRRIKTILNLLMPHYLKEEVVRRLVQEAFGQESEQKLVAELFMTVDELREIEAAGMEIGSHTVTHPKFSVLTLTEVGAELRKSREIFEREGFSARSFAYPFGGNFGDDAHHEVAKEFSSVANFLLADRQSPTENEFDIPRIDQKYLLENLYLLR